MFHWSGVYAVSLSSLAARCLKGSRQREIQDRARPHWQGQEAFLRHHRYLTLLLGRSWITHCVLHMC